jgi:hypothetical protein
VQRHDAASNSPDRGARRRRRARDRRAGSGRADSGPGPAVGGGVATAGCGPAVGADLQGRTGGSDITVCGSGPTFIAPDVGPIATVIGPTIITPAFVGNTVIVSAGNVALGVGG